MSWAIGIHVPITTRDWSIYFRAIIRRVNGGGVNAGYAMALLALVKNCACSQRTGGRQAVDEDGLHGGSKRSV